MGQQSVPATDRPALYSDQLLKASEDDFERLVGTLTPDDLSWLVEQCVTLDGVLKLVQHRRKRLVQIITTQLEYRNGGEKAVVPGTFLGLDGSGFRFTVTYKPGGKERKWDPERLRAFYQAVQCDPAAKALGIERHFRTEVVCKNIRNAKAAIEPLGGHVRDLFAGCYEEWDKEPTVEFVVTRDTETEG